MKSDVLILYKTYRVKLVFGKIHVNGPHKSRDGVNEIMPYFGTF
jgi:hypothetical protein